MLKQVLKCLIKSEVSYQQCNAPERSYLLRLLFQLSVVPGETVAGRFLSALRLQKQKLGKFEKQLLSAEKFSFLCIWLLLEVTTFSKVSFYTLLISEVDRT